MKKGALILFLVLAFIISAATAIPGQQSQNIVEVPVQSCMGEGELYLYTGDVFQKIDTSFTVNRSRLYILTSRTKEELGLSAKVNGAGAVIQTYALSPEKIYFVDTTPGSNVEIKAASPTHTTRNLQGYLAQDPSSPVYDLDTLQFDYRAVVTDKYYLTPGKYSYALFDKYTYNSQGQPPDLRRVSVKFEGPGGKIVDSSYTVPYPLGTEGAVVDDFLVTTEGYYDYTVDTEDSIYWPFVTCSPEPQKIPLHTCSGDGDLYLYKGDQFQPIKTSFTVSYDELLVFARSSAVLNAKVNGNPAAMQVVISPTTDFAVTVYKIATSPGDVVEIDGTGPWNARSVQGFLAQDAADPVYDISTLDVIFKKDVTNNVYLTAGNYNYLFFDKYSYGNPGVIDKRYLHVTIDGPGGKIADDNVTDPVPYPTQGAVVGSYQVSVEGLYSINVDTTDSIYFPLLECPVPECGDGVIDQDEECETPGTSNNEFCPQNTSDGCSGHKTSSRDAYGNCDAECGCNPDPFQYECVEGSCGATCDSDSDCPNTPCDDGCVGKDWYDYQDEPNYCTDSCLCTYNLCRGPTITQNDPRCTECQEDQDCDEFDRDYCNSTEIWHAEGRCIDYECQARAAKVIDCDDGLYCNGQESCENANCVLGQDVDCSGNDLISIDTCNNNPDSKYYTWDHFEGFTSVCDEGTDSCTNGTIEITHECDIDRCDAECEKDSDCPAPECNDGCVGRDWYEYDPSQNTCDDCFCNDNQCGEPSISYDDPRCTECQDNGDCDEYDMDYCNGTEIWHDEGVCVDYECKEQKSPVLECDDGLYCNGQESCSNANCVYGTDVDCSGYDLTAIERCDNNPDLNINTWDYFEGFTSVCNEGTDACTTGTVELTHECDIGRCDAECVTDSDCDEYSNGYCEDCNCKYDRIHDINITPGYYESVRGVRFATSSFVSIMDDIAVFSNNGIYKIIYKTINEGDFDENPVSFEAYLMNESGQIKYIWFPTSGPLPIPGHIVRTLTLDTGFIPPGLYTFKVNASIGPVETEYQDNWRTRQLRVVECTTDGDCEDSYACTEDACVNNACVHSPDDTICDNGIYCDGQEYCDAAFGCVNGEDVDCSFHDLDPVDVCDNNPDSKSYTRDYFGGFTSVCDETTDSCTTGSEIFIHTCDQQMCNAECDSDSDCPDTPCESGCVGPDWHQYADAENTCEECFCTDNQCGTPTILSNDPRCGECTTDEDCNTLDRNYCSGTEIWHDEGRCLNYACVPEPSLVEDCDDGKYCNGQESCSNANCVYGTDVDCSGYDLTVIARCDNNPDGNSMTWDHFGGFTSVCNEASDSCSTGTVVLTHTCDEAQCGAECDSDADCPETICQDGCVGNDYYDYEDPDNSCVNCECTNNQCSAPSISHNDPRCVSCSTDLDCNDLDRDYCEGSVDKHDEGRCINFECQAETTSTECDDGVYCNGEETCENAQCVFGTTVDCSSHDIEGIATCTNIPDVNPYTWDYRASFNSICDESTDSCTEGDPDITHICDSDCGSDPQCDGEYPGTGVCTIECKYKPPFFCERDGEWGIDFDQGHEYVCDGDNTYYRCNQEGTAYVHLNICAYYCSADLACDGKAPSSSLETCTTYGQDYLEDYCDEECHVQDDNCEDDFSGCTADPGCDEKLPFTGECNGECRIPECTRDSDCDDGIYCNGEETCDVITHECVTADEVDCSANDIAPVAACGNVPDGNSFTWDTGNGFISICDEGSGRCTTGTQEISHSCSISKCGADCETDNQCPQTDCDSHDGCVGNDYYDFNNIDNYCLGACFCTENLCEDPTISYDDPRCTECQNDADCADGIFCNGEERCVGFECQDGDNVDCSQYDFGEVQQCDYNPDGNPLTWDYSAGFISHCNEATDSCTTGDQAFEHVCDNLCGAECLSNADCGSKICDDGCIGGTYHDCQDVSQLCVDCVCDSASCEEIQTCQETGSDGDQDGWDVECGDCEDNDPEVNPGMKEICDHKDNDCDGQVDEGLEDTFFRISYSTQDTGDIIYLNGFDTFSMENVDFFHGYMVNKRGVYSGFGSMAARTSLTDGTDVKINVKWDVTSLVEQTCDKIVTSNYGRGTYWVYGEGISNVVYENMIITYHTLTGEIDVEGTGNVPFRFESMIDRKR